jgi:hypothetical protein
VGGQPLPTKARAGLVPSHEVANVGVILAFEKRAKKQVHVEQRNLVRYLLISRVFSACGSWLVLATFQRCENNVKCAG